MKNSKKYAQSIQKLFRSLKRKGPKVKKVRYDDIHEALVQAIVLEHMTETSANAAFKRFGDYFVDYNDMRVSRPEEIIEMLGEDKETTRKIASCVLAVMSGLFRKYNTINLESLRKTGKRQAKTLLEKFEGVSKFCVDYCMLTALDSHAIPLTETMVQYLRENELVDPDADIAEIEGFLTRQISSSNAYEFYGLLRRQSETKHISKGKKRTRRSKTDKASPQTNPDIQQDKTQQKGAETQNV